MFGLTKGGVARFVGSGRREVDWSIRGVLVSGISMLRYFPSRADCFGSVARGSSCLIDWVPKGFAMQSFAKGDLTSSIVVATCAIANKKPRRAELSGGAAGLSIGLLLRCSQSS